MRRIATAICLLLFLAGCDKPTPQVSNDIDLLTKAITLPARPAEACFVWQTKGDDVFGPSDHVIMALMRFDAASRSIIEQAAGPYPRDTEIVSLQASVIEPCRSLLSAMPVLPRCAGDPAKICIDKEERFSTAFYRGSFTDGRAFRLADGDWFIVFLFTT